MARPQCLFMKGKLVYESSMVCKFRGKNYYFVETGVFDHVQETN